MKIEKKTLLFMVSSWVLLALPLTLHAQSSLIDREIQPLDFPTADNTYLLQSGTSRSTIGTIGSDIDQFFSVTDFGAMKNMESNYGFAGIDENGLNIGYARKFKQVFLGLSYGGTLIDELFRRITNQDVNNIQKVDSVEIDNAAGTKTSTEYRILDAQSQTISGRASSVNNINIMFGVGIFGLKVGFSDYLEGIHDSNSITGIDGLGNKTITDIITASYDSNIKPSIEMGLNFKIGQVAVKPSIRAGVDIRQYSTSITSKESTINPITTLPDQILYTSEEILRDYMEPFAGVSLGFDFSRSSSTVAVLMFEYDGYYRLYSNNDLTGIVKTISSSVIGGGPPAFSSIITTTSDIFDFRNRAAPVFIFNSNLSDQFTLGVKANVEFEYNMLNVSEVINDSAVSFTQDKNGVLFSVTPEIDIGASFSLIPDHFAVHAGLGLELFSYSENTTIILSSGVDKTVTDQSLSMPVTKMAAGLTFNFTKTTALDILAVSSGLGIDTTKFTLLLSMKN
jgi:hypothetical protein